jgi:hypothetical protein
MYIFPSWVQHCVVPLAVNEEFRDQLCGKRVSFAFNFVATSLQSN